MRQSLWSFVFAAGFVFAAAAPAAAQLDPPPGQAPVKVPDPPKPAAATAPPAAATQAAQPPVAGWNVDKAIKHLQEKAGDKSQSACARFTREAINAGGMNVPGLGAGKNSAENYGPSLVAHGFKEHAAKDITTFKKGDVVVVQGTDKHKDGHMAMYDGKQWISDFKQKDINVWKDVANPSYKVYRYEPPPSDTKSSPVTRNSLGGVLVNPVPVKEGALPPGEAEKLLPKGTGPDGKPPVKWTIPLPKGGNP